jgi:polyisoprenyl-phosphate glycosyltransferase
MSSEAINYSVVIPVYNSEKTLDELTSRIKNVFEKLNKEYEIILVDDCSRDSSWEIMQKLNRYNKNIKIIHLIKNFGQHNAIICGFRHSSGQYIITLDDDLQHPPEEIVRLIDKSNEGYMVVYGKYIEKKHSIFENFFSNIFQYLIHVILKIPNNIYLSSFAIYDFKVTKNICSIKNSFPFLFALTIASAPTDKITNVLVNHNERKVGKSNYGVIKYFKYSLNLIINYSSLPLELVGITGSIISILSIIFGIFIIARKILNPNYGLMGWNSLIVSITLLNGIILMSVAIIGEYLRRILTETSYGQQYAIGETEI